MSQTGFYKVYISCIGRDGGEGVAKGYLLAKHLYRMLEQKGIHTFLMGRCNPDDRTGALDSAAVLVVVGASAAELTSDAVRNDYEDYIAGVELSGKRMWRVFNYSRGMSKGDLPDYLRLHRLYDHLDTDELVAKIEETLQKKPPKNCVSDEEEGEVSVQNAPACLPDCAESARESGDDGDDSPSVYDRRRIRARRAPQSEPEEIRKPDEPEFAGKAVSEPQMPVPVSPMPETEKKAVRVRPEKINKVEFSVVAPDEVKPGKRSVIDLLMYTRSQRSIVKRTIEMAKEKSSEAARSPGSVSVRQGSAVTAELFSDDIDVADNVREMVWSGDALDFKFQVKPPEDYKKKEIDFGCVVKFDGIEITRLYFTVAVNSRKKVAVRFTRKDCRKAFVSYCHKDKERVVQQLLAIQEVAPKLRFWMDSQSMTAGDVWRSAIASAIKGADVFLLFWSTAAKESEEVTKEWKFALALEKKSGRRRKNGARFISPVPLESPSQCPPPEELGDLHFGDPSFDSDVEDIDRVKFWSESGKSGNIRFI